MPPAYPSAYPPYAPPWPPPPQPLGPAPGLRYAGFWIRTLAALVDAVVTFALLLAVGVVASSLPTGDTTTTAVAAAAITIAALGGWLALQIVVPGRLGGTLGMRMLGMWIVREHDGSQIGYALAAGRLGVFLGLGWITLGVGALVDVAFVAFDPRKQAVHDKACSTLVVRRA
jgi:uncharacterized RDD family membrane protein YckC